MKISSPQSPTHDVRQFVAKLGTDICIARRKRNLTATMMGNQIGVAKSTYLKVEKGDPSVSMGTYAMVLSALGFGDALGNLADPLHDEIGISLDTERLPTRVRPRRTQSNL